jgi:hypothetical protein
MAAMTDNDPTGSTPPEEEPALSRQQEPDTSQPAEDPGYLTVTGEAAAEDGSVAAIIGGLPAVEGSAWDIGARWMTAVRARLMSRAAHRTRPVTRTQAAGESQRAAATASPA